jgi:hypothetical protein
VTPSPLAPCDFTLTKEDTGTFSYWGLERSKILVPLKRAAGFVGAVSCCWIRLDVTDVAGDVQVLLVLAGKVIIGRLDEVAVDDRLDRPLSINMNGSWADKVSAEVEVACGTRCIFIGDTGR